MDTGLGGMLEAQPLHPRDVTKLFEYAKSKQHETTSNISRSIQNLRWERWERSALPHHHTEKQVHAGAFATVQQWQVWDWWMASSNSILAKLLELAWMDMDRIDILGNHVTVSNTVKHVSKPLRCNEIQGFCDTAERRLAETEAVSCGGFLDILSESAMQPWKVDLMMFLAWATSKWGYHRHARYRIDWDEIWYGCPVSARWTSWLVRMWTWCWDRWRPHVRKSHENWNARGGNAAPNSGFVALRGFVLPLSSLKLTYFDWFLLLLRVSSVNLPGSSWRI